MSQTGNIMVETSGQLVKPIPSPLEKRWENAGETFVYDKQWEQKNNGNNDDGHDELN